MTPTYAAKNASTSDTTPTAQHDPPYQATDWLRRLSAATDLTHAEMRVALYLYTCANPATGRGACPSMRQLSDNTGIPYYALISKKGIPASLCRKGWLKRTAAPARGKPAIYRMATGPNTYAGAVAS